MVDVPLLPSVETPLGRWLKEHPDDPAAPALQAAYEDLSRQFHEELALWSDPDEALEKSIELWQKKLDEKKFDLTWHQKLCRGEKDTSIQIDEPEQSQYLAPYKAEVDSITAIIDCLKSIRLALKVFQ